MKESLTLLSPDGQANVIFSAEPLNPDIDLSTYATTQLDLLDREFPGFELIGEDEEIELPGAGPAIRRQFTWTPPDGLSVIQTQIYAVTVGRGYTATATTTSQHFDNVRYLLFDALSSLEIDDGAAAR